MRTRPVALLALLAPSLVLGACSSGGATDEGLVAPSLVTPSVITPPNAPSTTAKALSPAPAGTGQPPRPGPG